MENANRVASSEQGCVENRFEEIIGDSPALESVLAEVERVAPTDSTVLVLGETGTGKELIARAIHHISPRCGRPFIKLNCAAIPFDLLESELFGHERGAFTGAVAQKIGRFEMADTGTLFLDEIGDIPLALQPKLLRVLQEQEFERLGSGRTHRINVRLVAATHRDLAEMVKRNEFRSDLYYRLNVFPVCCHHCGSAGRISHNWSRILSGCLPGAWASTSIIFRRKRWMRSPRILGRGTCGNFRT